MGQVSIHLPERLVAAIDKIANAEGVSRSHVCRVAMERFVGEPAPELLEDILSWHFQLLDPAAVAALDALFAHDLDEDT